MSPFKWILSYRIRIDHCNGLGNTSDWPSWISLVWIPAVSWFRDHSIIIAGHDAQYYYCRSWYYSFIHATPWKGMLSFHWLFYLENIEFSSNTCPRLKVPSNFSMRLSGIGFLLCSHSTYGILCWGSFHCCVSCLYTVDLLAGLAVVCYSCSHCLPGCLGNVPNFVTWCLCVTDSKC